MVNPSKIISSLFAFGFVSRCHAEYSEATQTVTYVPIVEEWAGEGSSLTVNFDLINFNYISLYNGTSAQSKRTQSKETMRTATVIGSEASTIVTTSSSPKLYNFIAGMIEGKSDANSCGLTVGVNTENNYFLGHAYKATTSGSSCHTKTEGKTILSGVEKCANRLHEYGATRGCCTLTLGGTWTGHLRLTAEPIEYPATSATC
ncbi:uncharacterized protein N7496_010318 [Penicillium cataractarum]|uniref:Secreted protein CSS2 C-terminal domain-containing protein n=1 Tax=Penicillium cataractarum TaxID=2100454 RepID=A0A9W9RS12_9EURO|nr:uncharacterized protein N7496_010318 [Penicillium cataractarum]KAJ5364605.1 hypothetical protein N7496_010318 [Penicillium cataractarum]